MEEINHHLRKEIRKKTIYQQKIQNEAEKIQISLKEEYKLWLNDLKFLIDNKLYRQTLKEIEEKKYKYESIKNETWKFRIIKAKAILKIIKIKMRKYPNEIVIENSPQNISLKFWYNQIFFTLEELILEFRYDINEHLDYSSKKIIEPVQTIIQYHLEFIYYLCIFSIKSNEVIPFISYLSIVDRFIPFIQFFSKIKLLNLYQNILLLKIKLLIENFDFLSAFDNIKLVFKLCFREMHLFMDIDSEIIINYKNSLNNKKKNPNKGLAGFYIIIQKIILAFFLRGVACEHLGYFKKSVEAYRQCWWFSNKFMLDYNKELFKYFRNLEKKYLNYTEIFDDIHKQFSNKKIFENINKEKNKFFKKKYIITSYKNSRYKRTNLSTQKLPLINRSNIKFKSMIIDSPDKKEKLEILLSNIGDSLYKEEENRNNSIFKKYTKNCFVLSTVNMIDNLLSKDFKHILKKMDKVELTKPNEEINHLINWTFNIKRQKDFKNIYKKKIKNKIEKRNNSCTEMTYLNKKKLLFKSVKQPLNLIKNYKSSKNEKASSEKLQLKNYKKLYKSKSLQNGLNSFDNILKAKSLLSTSKNDFNNINNKASNKKNKKILKYPLNKDIFSKSLLSKKNYLDSIYEKELNFQKKLLELKGYDMQKYSDNFNAQKVINSAEKNFKILNCFAESKNTKKNLLNLVKDINEFQAFQHMFPFKKLRDRSQKLNLVNLRNFMLLHHIGTNKPRYDPNDVTKNNEEKSKILSMECAKIEQLEKKNKEQRKILMNKCAKKRSKSEKKFY